MKPHRHFASLALALTLATGAPPAATAHSAHHSPHAQAHDAHEDHEAHDEHADAGVSQIAPAMARELGISVRSAGPGTLHRTLTTFGQLVTPPSQESHIRARFPGLITQVHARLGETVKAGDLLAEVESNESLRTYQIRAPIDGLVIERHANIGEFAQDQVLFTVVDFDPLWAELRVFPGQRAQVAPGQPVALSTAELRQAGAVAQLVPGGADKPYVLARVALDNRDHLWLPGLWVQGEIAVETLPVALVVANRALQTYQGETVVFVQQGERYTPRPLQLGRSDGHYSEVRGGLAAGETYVLDNSYLIKADLEKSSAAHEH